jgi:hypothetical protein
MACLTGMATNEVMVSAPLLVLVFDRGFVAGTIAEAWRRRWPVHVGALLHLAPPGGAGGAHRHAGRHRGLRHQRDAATDPYNTDREIGIVSVE